MAGTLGYLVLFVQAFLFPGFERTLWTNPLLALTHASNWRCCSGCSQRA
jgi:hypothetical protein